MPGKIRLTLWSILLASSALWFQANTPFPDAPSFIDIRNFLVQYSGVMGMVAMSVAMILALRPSRIEPWLGGLDKSYRLHKWLGITGLTAAICHWIAANGPHWLSDLGLIEGRKGPRPPGTDPDSLGAIQQFLGELRHPAESVGEWAFYAAVLLIALALIKRFPYRLFAKTHTLIAIAYLALVFHTIVLLNFSAWSQPLGIVMALLLGAGVVAAFIVLSRQVGKRKQVKGTIAATRYFPAIKVLETSIQLESGWHGHKSGQFAFVSFDAKEGQHPFTIASAWDPANPTITFFTKALGDYTELLPERLRLGASAVVEGPYGTFTFDDGAQRQIWVGAGIGITPFIARMRQLSVTPKTQPIDLFYCTTELLPEVAEQLNAEAAAAGVTLHVMLDSRDGRLDGAKLRAAVPDWRSASIWFCGPAGFGSALNADLSKNGLPHGAFHQELFNMR